METLAPLIGSLVITAAVGVFVVVVFLICRAIILWYWKIDKIEEHLAAIRNSLGAQSLSSKDGPITESKRNAELTVLAGRMRQYGASQSSIEAKLLQVNKERCSPPLPDDEVLRIARSKKRP
jgi:hypothetical protein